jgi:catechol 2,3-dioxygenase-like lactoylglutathione lyase family enzyme
MSEKTGKSGKEMFTDFVQIGVVVADLDKSMQALTDIFGIGPWRSIVWPPPDRTDIERYYFGEPREFTARMAFTELGPIELELIQPLDNVSIWADFLRDQGGGIHHIRFNVPDLGPVIEYLDGQGIQAAQTGSGLRPGTNWANFDSAGMVGFVIEAMNVVPGTSGRTPEFSDGKVKA